MSLERIASPADGIYLSTKSVTYMSANNFRAGISLPPPSFPSICNILISAVFALRRFTCPITMSPIFGRLAVEPGISTEITPFSKINFPDSKAKAPFSVETIPSPRDVLSSVKTCVPGVTKSPAEALIAYATNDSPMKNTGQNIKNQFGEKRQNDTLVDSFSFR